ncbi:MAG: Holliday junction branch migration protein RuvA [Patescibacteria group bacterium]
MIGFLRGTVLRIRKKKLILDVGGVGYEVAANSGILTFAKVGVEKKLWIHTHQTADSTALFGFENEGDLEFFELLNSVNGVGPRTALEILETPVEQLKQIIVSSDAKKLGDIKGIGKKTAARIVLELRSKIAGGAIEVPSETDVDPEILDAIVGLGYSKKTAAKILTQLPAEISKPEEIVKWFLQNA